MEIKLIVLFLAIVVDRVVGDPDRLWRVIPHPVTLFGKAISFAEKRYNRRSRAPGDIRRSGMLVMLVLMLITALVGATLHLFLLQMGFLGALIEIIIVAVFLAQKSLADHVGRVAAGLRSDGLEGGRKAVSMIVGRDPQALVEGGISRAAIESLAENASDGVVAPVFWYAVLGLPGLFVYKLINTADSMIGHLNSRYRDFGRFAARTDDVVNWIPARLTGLLTLIAVWLEQGRSAAVDACKVMMRDARLHRSPNAGWPEAAFAGALDLALAGPRQYGEEKVEGPMLNEAGRRDAKPDDIDAALRLFWKVMSVMSCIVLAAGLVGLIP